MSEMIDRPAGTGKDTNGKNGTSHETHGGLTIQRFFTTPGIDPLDTVVYEKRRSAIYDADGSVVFAMDSLEIPKDWSQLATDIVVSKYFRKAGVPETGTETSVRQVVYRVARTIREGAEELGGYFATKEDADSFEAELTEILINQKGAFNSPVWFNVGLHHRYNIKGSGGNYFWDKTTDQIKETTDAYSHPQASACFIQSINDDLMSIFELVKTESRVFKYGSGSGTNFSNLRGNKEKLSGGGTSSGLMSFLEVFDRAAGATKSGGTTRRAAKMVILDIDHPEIVDFVTWKAREEKKVAALIAAGYPADFNGEAYRTVGGQNSNNSVRVTDEFMKAYEDDRDFSTRNRTNKQISQTYKARDLMRQIAQAAWACADPGMQYDTTINDWHTCSNSGRINASNPCVTGDTLIATSEGMVRIDALLAKGTSVVGADGKLHPIEPAFKTGTKPVYQLRTKAGFTLKLTGDHRVFTLNRGDVQACELTKDDVLPLGKTVFGSTALDPRLAEFLGLAIGDGCLVHQENNQENIVLTLTPGEEAVARYAHQQLTSYRKEFGKDGREARDTDVHNSQGTWRLQTSARCVVDELKRHAILDGGSEKKAFLEGVFQLDKASVASLLRGLFTADGTVANYGEKSKYISLDSTSLALLQQTQLLLLSFGIKAKLYRDRRVAGHVMALLPDGKGGRKEYPVQQMHSLRISRSSREIFAQEIGFIQGSEKQGKLAELNQSTSTYADRLEDRVESLSFIGEQPVYDLTEPVTHHFVANGVVVHNCSEYLFLDDTACNLSSINLTKFLREDGSFDIEGYRHTARILLIAQEILVDFSSYPTDKIAKNSHDYRPLGLGYANLGTLLMILGLPYDSDEGRAHAAALTSIMHGEAYKASAEMARYKGPFPGYAKNKEPMLRVMRKHQGAADKINEKHLPKELASTSKQVWREALSLGEKHGYRNSQVSVLAPTGTIGLLMDCDTTGVEPDFSLVKFKKLAGGGYFKIVNESVPRALKALGYSPRQINEIIAYARGTQTLEGTPHINMASLKAKGLHDADLEKVQKALPGAFDLNGAFSFWTLGEETYKRLGISASAAKEKGFNALQALGFGRKEIEEASDIVCGRMTTEGAPHLKQEHYAVFDCANRCGRIGKRFIEPMGHLRMMGAVQPFLSGAISKTVNIPSESTVEDVEDLYVQGWKLGLKAVAIYRDGSKLSQPLSTKSEEKKDNTEVKTEVLKAEPKKLSAAAELDTTPTPRRRRLPKKRYGFTQEVRIGGQKLYIRTGEYEDGTLGEIFIDMHKEGAAFRSMMNAFAISVSLGLQYGVPLDEYVDVFTFTRFEPQGITDHPNIRSGTSVLDFIFRLLGMEYLGRTDFVQVPPILSAADDKMPAFTSATAKKLNSEPVLSIARAGDAGGVVQEWSAPQAKAPEASNKKASSLSTQMSKLMGDAPFCDTCGHLTIRNGSCYKCLNCGNSMGCS